MSHHDPFDDLAGELRDGFLRGESVERIQKRRQALADALTQGLVASTNRIIEEWDRPPEPCYSRIFKALWRRNEPLRFLFTFPPFLLALMGVIFSILMLMDAGS